MEPVVKEWGGGLPGEGGGVVCFDTPALHILCRLFNI